LTKRLLVIHYTPPAVIGGVEHIMQEHLRLFENAGFSVGFVAGREGEPGASVTVIPEIDPARGTGGLVERQLDSGDVTPAFHDARDSVLRQLRPLVREADTVIVHNAFTLHFSLPLTAALWQLAREGLTSMIAWCHDLAWSNPLYVPLMHNGGPWELLRRPAPGVCYVTVSEERRRELSSLWGRAEHGIEVVPNGIDPDEFLLLSPGTREIVRTHLLYDRDIVLLLPVRITRRKNIESAIRVIRALCDRGLDPCFLVSGPEALHHPGRSARYLDTLTQLASELDVERHVIFLAAEMGANPDDRTVSELYSVADVLLFPSSSEGFGIPILEAGLRRVPVVLTDIPIFREVGGQDVVRFDLDEEPDSVADAVLRSLDKPPARLYRRILREYRWEALANRRIIPLLEHVMRDTHSE